MKRHKNVATYAAVGTLAALLAGCSASPESGQSVPAATKDSGQSRAASPAATASGASNIEDFCAAADPMLVPVAREFIGSDEHVAQFRALLAAAPDDLVDVIVLLEHHYDVSVSPAEPDSQDFDNFPQAVKDGAVQLSDAIDARCEGAA